MFDCGIIKRETTKTNLNVVVVEMFNLRHLLHRWYDSRTN